MPTNMPTDISPLAQRLADTYEVDLSALREKYAGENDSGKITARNVLEHLHTAGDRVPLKRKRKPTGLVQKSAAEGLGAQPVDEAKPDLGFNLMTTAQGGAEMSELTETGPSKAATESVLATTPEQPLIDKGSALAQTRAQLQATARVHQQALLEVGSLRQQNTTLGTEVERLRAAEAKARADLEELAARKLQLERELESKDKGAFAWLRRLVS